MKPAHYIKASHALEDVFPDYVYHCNDDGEVGRRLNWREVARIAYARAKAKLGGQITEAVDRELTCEILAGRLLLAAFEAEVAECYERECGPVDEIAFDVERRGDIRHELSWK